MHHKRPILPHHQEAVTTLKAVRESDRWKGKIRIPDNFDAVDKEIERAFY